MTVTYIKLFVDYLDAIELLGDAERGRLFTSLLEYAKTGEVSRLSGNERFIFPMMRAQIDRDMNSLDDLSAVRSESGKKGGRPKKQTEAKKAIASEKSKKSKDKDKEEDEDYIRERVERENPPRTSPPTLEEITEYCLSEHLRVNPRRFYSYYSANGWMIGKTPMVDWRAALRAWNETEDVRDAAPSVSSFETDDFFEAALKRSFEEGANC